MELKPPIPSPFPEPDYSSFRAAFIPMFAVSYLLSAVGILLLTYPVSHGREIFIGLAANAMMGAVHVAVVINAFRTAVSPEGIFGHNAWCVPRQLEWDEIASVRRINLLGLKYLKLSSHTRKNVLWIPLFLADMSGFKAAVAQFAHIDHPLREALP